jgi:hypothetical protein
MSFTYSRLIDRQSFRCLVFDELLVDKVAPIVTSPNFSINNPTRNRSARNKNRPYVPNISPGGLRIWAGYRGSLLAVGNHLSPRNVRSVSPATIACLALAVSITFRLDTSRPFLRGGKFSFGNLDAQFLQFSKLISEVFRRTRFLEISAT